MKITIESHDKSIIEVENNDLNIHEMMDLLERLLLGSGYHPNTVKDGFIAKAQAYENN